MFNESADGESISSLTNGNYNTQYISEEDAFEKILFATVTVFGPVPPRSIFPELTKVLWIMLMFVRGYSGTN